MRFSKLALLGLVLAVGLSVAACDIKTDASGEFSFDISGGKAQDTWTRTYTLPDKGRLELINVNGRITAEPATDGKVSVEGRQVTVQAHVQRSEEQKEGERVVYRERAASSCPLGTAWMPARRPA